MCHKLNKTSTTVSNIAHVKKRENEDSIMCEMIFLKEVDDKRTRELCINHSYAPNVIKYLMNDIITESYSNILTDDVNIMKNIHNEKSSR